jgi:hypothetical protein
VKKLTLLFALLLVFGGTAAAEAHAQYRWKELDPRAGQDLYFDGRHVGHWSYADRRYWAWNGSGWVPTACPCQPPVRNFGVGGPEDGGGRGMKFSLQERATIGGKEVTPAEAKRRLAEGAYAGDGKQLPDDRGQPFFVVVGTEADQARARAVIESAAFKGLGRAQYYRPDDAMIRDRDGKQMYAAGVTVVSPGGTVAGFTAAYDSAEDLAEGVRRLDPKVDPAKFPSLKDRALGAATPVLVPAALAGGGALLLASLAGVALLRKK